MEKDERKVMWVALVRCVIALDFLDGFLNSPDFWQLNGTWVKGVCAWFFTMNSLCQVEYFVCVSLVMVCIWLIIYPLSSSHTLCHGLIPGIDRLDPRTLSGRDQPLSTVVLPHPWFSEATTSCWIFQWKHDEAWFYGFKFSSCLVKHDLIDHLGQPVSSTLIHSTRTMFPARSISPFFFLFFFFTYNYNYLFI